MYLSSGIYWSLVVIWTINQTFQRVVTCQKDFWTSANLQCFRDKSLFSFSEYLRIYQENLTIRVLLFYGQCQEVFRTYLSTSFPRGERRLWYMLLFISFHSIVFIEDVCTSILKCTLGHSSEVIWELICIHLYTWTNSRVTKLWSKKCSIILLACKNSTVKVMISKIMKLFHMGTLDLYTWTYN